MNWPKVSVGVVFLAGAMGLPLLAAQQERPVPPPVTPPASSATPAPSPGIIEGMLAKSPSQSGYLDAQQVKSLMDQVRFAEYRINDLLTDVHPERWKKMPESAQNSFQQTLATLKAQMQALKGWRQQFTARPGSMYAAFETYATIDAVLPRLEGVGRTVSQADNSSFGVQFSQAADRLFNLQQKLSSYLEFLLQNQDMVQQALENNLAGCQNDLGHAMRGQTERYKWKRNSAPVRAHRTTVRSSEKQRRTSEEEKKTPPEKKP